MDQYTLHTIAAVVFEIAHLTTGILLCVLGKSLLEKGIKGDFLGEGEVVSKKFRLVTASPGIVFLIAGLVVITTAVFTQTEFVQIAAPTGAPADESAKSTPPPGAPTMQTTSRLLEGSASRGDSRPAPLDNARIVRGLATILAAANPNPSESYGAAIAIVEGIRNAKNDDAQARRGRVAAAIDELAAKHKALLPHVVLDPEYDWLLNDEFIVKSLHAHLMTQMGQSMTPKRD